VGFISEERAFNSPFIETITVGRTAGDGTTIRPAESHWHMVFVKYQGRMQAVVTGALTSAGVVSFTEGAEIIWIKFKHGTFMPHMPAKTMLDNEIVLPEAASNSFYLHGSAWQFPDFENVDTFLDRMVRTELLVRDPIVNAALQDQQQDIDMASRTIRYRFARATGLTQTHIRQIERARQAAALLEQGKSILDTVHEVGYFDQPHLTRALKQWVGHTPAQILRSNQTT
jgi:AraC-like DNA-binding protein